MRVEQFDDMIDEVLRFLQMDCVHYPDSYRKSGENFEPCVKRGVDWALKTMKLEEIVDYTPGGHGFPDIVIVGDDGNKFGIEVKSSSSLGNKWRLNGNSVLGSTREPDICKTVIVFGKVRGEKSLFRAKEYEQCIANVVVTHSPRYLIDLDIDEGNSFFDRSNLTYSEINDSDQPIKLITDYFVSIGQTAWWLAESTPAAIQMFGKLECVERGKLMGYAFAHFTEIFSNSGAKFYRYMTWLASEKSIIDPALRDRFTAGGKANVYLEHVTYNKLPRIFQKLHEYRKYTIDELQNADLEKLKIDWEMIPMVSFKQRLEQWATMVFSQIPNQEVEHVDKKKMVLDIILDSLEY